MKIIAHIVYVGALQYVDTIDTDAVIRSVAHTGRIERIKLEAEDGETVDIPGKTLRLAHDVGPSDVVQSGNDIFLGHAAAAWYRRKLIERSR